jgi:hypothetical protein
MAISFVAAGTVGTGSNPNVTVPAGIQKDDLLLIVTAGSATPTTPTGWTQLAAQGAGQFITVLFKFATASEATVNLTQSGTSSKAVMVAYRGAGGVEVLPAFTTGSSTTATPNTVTTTYTNDYVISLYACAVNTTTFTPNASTTSRVNSAATAALRGLLIADELQAAAGTSTARAATLSTTRSWSAIPIAIIEAPRVLYWVGGNGTWDASTTTRWSNTSGGAGGVVAPTLVDDTIINASSGSPTVTLSGSPSCKSLTTTGATCTIDSTGALSINGGMTLSSTTTWTASGNLNFLGTGTITTNAVSIASGITLNGPSQTFTLGDTLNTSTTFTLTAGTLALGTNSLNASAFSTSNSNTRSISFGSGSAINLSAGGTAVTVWQGSTATGFSTSGTPTVNFTYTGGTSTRTIVHGTTGDTATTAAINFNITAGSDTVSITSNSAIQNLNATGFSGTLSFLSGSIYGSLTLVSGITWTNTGTLTFRSTSSGQTITTAGKTIDTLTFNGVGGAWTLQDNLTVSSGITLTNGSLTTNDKTVNATTFTSSNANVRTLNLGSSTINLSSTGNVWNLGTTTNLTFNSGTSQINLTGSTFPDFLGGGLTYYNLNFSNSPSAQITGNNTFNTLSFSTLTSTAALELTGTTQTVTNFNVDGGSYTNFITLTGGTLSKSSGTVSLSFAAISTAATGGATWNAFGCRQLSAAATGWNFGAQTRYLVGAGAISDFDAVGRWSTTSGGAANAMSPFQFDDVIFDTNSGSVTFSVTTSNDSTIKSLNASTFTGIYNVAAATTLNVYGSFILGSSMTLTGKYSNLYLYGTTSGNLLTIGTSNKNIANSLYLNCSSGDYTLTTNCTIDAEFDLLSGTFNFGSNTFTADRITDLPLTGNATLNLNSSTINLNGTSNPFNYVRLIEANTTVNAGTSTINLVDFSTSASGFDFTSNKTFNVVNLNGIVAGEVVSFNSSPTISRLTTNNTVGGYTLQFQNNTTTTIGQFDIRGTAGNLVSVLSSSTSVNATLASLGSAVQSNIDYISFTDITASPTPTATGTVPYYWYVGANSTQDTATTGLVFSSDASYTYYNLTSGTSWSVPANWNNSVNNVYLIGGGGGGSGSVVASSTGSHNSGSGGGGGGFTALTNTTLTAGGTVSYAIGAAGANGTGSTSASTAGGGGTTTFNISNTAGGGGGAATGLGTRTAGTAGTGSTFNGGTGGLGTAPGTNTTNAGGGGAGSGGLDGAGVGGGANSGATIGTGGAGNNNLGDYLFVSGAPYGDGGNGGSTTGAGVAATGRGGGGGGGGTTAGSATVRAGALGTQGVIVLRYQVPAAGNTGNFLTFFYQ